VRCCSTSTRQHSSAAPAWQRCEQQRRAAWQHESALGGRRFTARTAACGMVTALRCTSAARWGQQRHCAADAWQLTTAWRSYACAANLSFQFTMFHSHWCSSCVMLLVHA
jgi:hypothetical protein